MAAKKHIHKYYRTKINGVTQVWACALPDCSHYMPQHMEDMVAGKMTYCWKCGEKMQLNPNQLEMDKPQCDGCLGILGNVEFSPALKKILEEKGII